MEEPLSRKKCVEVKESIVCTVSPGNCVNKADTQ